MASEGRVRREIEALNARGCQRHSAEQAKISMRGGTIPADENDDLLLTKELKEVNKQIDEKQEADHQAQMKNYEEEQVELQEQIDKSQALLAALREDLAEHQHARTRLRKESGSTSSGSSASSWSGSGSQAIAGPERFPLDANDTPEPNWDWDAYWCEAPAPAPAPVPIYQLAPYWFWALVLAAGFVWLLDMNLFQPSLPTMVDMNDEGRMVISGVPKAAFVAFHPQMPFEDNISSNHCMLAEIPGSHKPQARCITYGPDAKMVAKDCPSDDTSGLDGADDRGVYDLPTSDERSPIQEEAERPAVRVQGAVKLP